MNKETINKYLDTLYLKSKNDLRTGCSTKVLAELLVIDNNTAQNILHYLSGKGYIDTKNNYGDNISLTPEGYDFVHSLREGKQFKVIKFYKSIYAQPSSVMKFGFLFWYDLTDENGKIAHKTIGAFASDVLSTTWGLRFDEVGIKNSEKILLQFAKNHISNKITEGTLLENEEFTLMTASQPQICPYNANNLVETKFAEFEIEINKENSFSPNHSNKIDEKKSPHDHPIVFISYSWDDLKHKEWILNLAKKLLEKGIDVILDQFELGPGKNMIYFMESAIPKACKVLIIFTPNYKLKAEKRQGGVGFEYSILNTELYNQITTNKKFIPVLRVGDSSESIPSFMQQFIAVDMREDEISQEKLLELVYAIYDKPMIEKPKPGPSPFLPLSGSTVSLISNNQEIIIELLKNLKERTTFLWIALYESKADNSIITEDIKESTLSAIKNSIDKLKLMGLLTYETKYSYDTITTKEKVYLISVSHMTTELRNLIRLIHNGER
ncbi:MAG: toll/interleukin-1 receptor domain-containing protein [Ginsengibacter sp.]